MILKSYIYLGWSPILAVATDGTRRVLEVTGWTGGNGTAPATGVYVGESGYVSDISLAVDVGASIIVSSTPPVSPSLNQIWIQI